MSENQSDNWSCSDDQGRSPVGKPPSHANDCHGEGEFFTGKGMVKIQDDRSGAHLFNSSDSLFAVLSVDTKNHSNLDVSPLADGLLEFPGMQ